MSVRPPASTHRTPPTPERVSHRADRSPARDFAALLDPLPAAPAARRSASGRERSELPSALERREPSPGGRDRDAKSAHGETSRHACADSQPGDTAEARAETAAAPPPTVVAETPAAPRDDPARPVDVVAQTAAAPLPAGAAGTVELFAAVAMGAGAEPNATAGTATPVGAPASVPAGPSGNSLTLTSSVATPGQAAGALAAEVPADPPAPVPGAAAATGAPVVPASASEPATAAVAPVPPSGEAAIATAPDVAAPGAGRPTTTETPPEGPGAEATVATTAEGSFGASADAGSGQDGERAGSRAEPSPAPAPGSPAPPAVGLGAPVRPLDGMPLGQHRAVPLERAPRAVAQLLHVGSQGGVSHARIALRPVELGGIEIFLQSGPAGLSAQVVAESPEAARMLQQATEDLRRALARHDVELVSLDVSTSSEQRGEEFAARDGREDLLADGSPRDGRRGSGPDDEATAESTSTTPTVLELPDGLLVDVLA